MVNGEGIGYPTQPTRGPAEGREIPSCVWTHPRPKINLGNSIELPESHWWQSFSLFYDFYRAMHFSAKRGIAIACRLSVCLSVCNVGEL